MNKIKICLCLIIILMAFLTCFKKCRADDEDIMEFVIKHQGKDYISLRDECVLSKKKILMKKDDPITSKIAKMSVIYRKDNIEMAYRLKIKYCKRMYNRGQDWLDMVNEIKPVKYRTILLAEAFLFTVFNFGDHYEIRKDKTGQLQMTVDYQVWLNQLIKNITKDQELSNSFKAELVLAVLNKYNFKDVRIVTGQLGEKPDMLYSLLAISDRNILRISQSITRISKIYHSDDKEEIARDKHNHIKFKTNIFNNIKEIFIRIKGKKDIKIAYAICESMDEDKIKLFMDFESALEIRLLEIYVKAVEELIKRTEDKKLKSILKKTQEIIDKYKPNPENIYKKFKPPEDLIMFCK